MIDEFIRKHGITLYRLARLLEVKPTSMRRWAKSGPQHPEVMRRALRDLEREMEKS